MHILCSHWSIQYNILNLIWKLNKTFLRPAVDLAYLTYGPNPSESPRHIVVLHGLLGSKKNWGGMCNRIAGATKVCVIAADLRNHGDSPHHAEHVYPELAADVSALITKLSLNTVHLIGHSMGGRTAMYLALTEPSKIASLIAVDISPVSSASALHEFFPQLFEVLVNVNFTAANSLSSARKAARDAITASGLIPAGPGMDFIVMNVGKLSDNSFGWKINMNALKNNFQSIAAFPPDAAGKQYPGPTLFVAGGQSPYVPKEDHPGIKQLFPAVEITYIEHVGHNAHAEDANAFFNIIHPFLTKHLGT